MKNWFTNLLKTRPAPGEPGQPVPPPQGFPSAQAGEWLVLQKETQALRMDLQASQQAVANLKQENERLRLRQDQLIAETVETRLSGLFGDLAAPASQVLTQSDLLEKEGKPVQARDVLSVARRMVRALERYGLVFSGQVGDQVPFDPNQHTPINEVTQPQPGQPVTIRFRGVAYQGKTIHKAIVE